MNDPLAALVSFLFAEDRRNHPIPAEKSEKFLQKIRTHICIHNKNKKKEDQHG